MAPLEGKTANTPRVGPVSTSRHRIAELARQAVGMAVAIAWLPGPAGTRRRVAKPSVEEPDAAEPARPDLWGARVSNDPGLPDLILASEAVLQKRPDRLEEVLPRDLFSLVETPSMVPDRHLVNGDAPLQDLGGNLRFEIETVRHGLDLLQ